MKNIVFIVNLPESKKQGRNAPYHYSVKSWEKWCDKNNHLLFVLDQRIHEEDFMNANWHKIYALELLDANEIDYDQVLIADADTIIHPNAPNIFSLPDNKFCAVHGFGSYDWICRSIENYKKYVFPNVDVDLFDYFNSGSENTALYIKGAGGINSSIDVCFQRYSDGVCRGDTVNC